MGATETNSGKMQYLQLRPQKSTHTINEASCTSTPYSQQRHAPADFSGSEEDLSDVDEQDTRLEDEADIENEDGERPHLLPIFSAAHLDALPVYSLTHAIRLIVLPRTETTLTWDQLRSPQVSQFLVKPMQQQIRTSHFSRATLYALMANCLQFQKESQSNPGTAGTSKTRALVCELLGIKLLKEFNTRELIDALSYDFFPLQGVEQATITSQGKQPRDIPAIVRISTLEIAIRASAKRFLAQPLVIQQLESIWAGIIVFHSQADNLHRRHPKFPRLKNETTYLQVPERNLDYGTSRSPTKKIEFAESNFSRRTVTIYDPKNASLLKLSRLRVPRYRQFFSTCSLAILLGLFLAVLSRRSMEITPLEVFFWFWSAGFMLDEVVGFNEQGFSLYIMSFWNAFDMGILLLLSIYYCMRLYGIFLVDVGQREWNSMAYDVLATSAVLLFPRLFSVLDHYRYFSQLLIAFRLMAIDLAAVFILILVSCSGFFVAFSLSFSRNEYDAAEVAYKIFQILMGFTPAAWEAWDMYNPLGRALMVLFLFTCHFLVVTILITVLTNSFMAIVSNADQEHQFVFAVNTISMVKNDALFSYVAPTNVLAWFLTPMRLFLPFRIFIKINRTAIKITHLPLLFGIFSYEKIFLSGSVYESIDLAERGRKRGLPFQDPTIRLRQESTAGYKDQALDEVFRLKPKPDTLKKSMQRMNTHNVIRNWMNQQSPPENSTAFNRLEQKSNRFNQGISGTRSAASDPIITITGDFNIVSGKSNNDGSEDGDDELNTNDDASQDETTQHGTSLDKDIPGLFPMSGSPSLKSVKNVAITAKKIKESKTQTQARRYHNRNESVNTVIQRPVSPIEPSSVSHSAVRPINVRNSGTVTPGSLLDRKTPKASFRAKSYPRVAMPTGGFTHKGDPTRLRVRQIRHRRSSLEMGTSQIGVDSGMLGAVPSSFATQMAIATGAFKNNAGSKDDDDMMGRLMLARMKTLEEGFAEVVKEFKVMRAVGSYSTERNEKSTEKRSRRGLKKISDGSYKA
ncbi:putative integral membrane channel protein [Golovinomyces cichoracearum]|uniref:Putative integral membrane channel protein n=1 Tax=Golovinomyces cichoracearum TaxID=62708 RepID=A0A420IGT2_9PEZI|nr:putative integral membrane channel protein [Golovinomyces cichoracearum]